MAQAIYVSLIFDTGFFRHDSTTAETMKIATKLYEKNIPFTKLAEQTMLVMSFPAKKLLARTLSNMKIECGGRVAIATLSNRDLKECGAEEDDKEGLIDHVFLTPGVEVGALVLGLDAKVSKVSFRSRTDFDVAQFARSIAPKGGGHRKAAGCTLDMDAAAAEKHVLKNLVESFS
jgi:phosphoesterase RecJ-like protein